MQFCNISKTVGSHLNSLKSQQTIGHANPLIDMTN